MRCEKCVLESEESAIGGVTCGRDGRVKRISSFGEVWKSSRQQQGGRWKMCFSMHSCALAEMTAGTACVFFDCLWLNDARLCGVGALSFLTGLNSTRAHTDRKRTLTVTTA